MIKKLSELGFLGLKDFRIMNDKKLSELGFLGLKDFRIMKCKKIIQCLN